MRALSIPAVALVLAAAAAGCDTDHDTIPDKIQAAALAESSEAYEEGGEALVSAIRDALNEAPPAPFGTFTASNGFVLTDDPADPTNVTVNGTVVVDRSEEGEAPVEATIAGGVVPVAGGPIASGAATMTTDAHVDLGGGRGGHAHGGAEAEEEPETTMPIRIDVAFPAPAGALVFVGFQGGAVPIVLEQDFPEVPPP